MKTKTKAELRIEIAKDVLKHIKAEKIIAQCGTYFSPKTKAKYKGKQLQEVLPKIKECRVCALGGMFYSYVNRHNNFKVADKGLSRTTFYDTEMRDLIDMFPIHQLNLIECAFEGIDIGSNCYRSDKVAQRTLGKAENYREKHDLNILNLDDNGDEKALIHIMKNIIRNKGTFKP